LTLADYARIQDKSRKLARTTKALQAKTCKPKATRFRQKIMLCPRKQAQFAVFVQLFQNLRKTARERARVWNSFVTLVCYSFPSKTTHPVNARALEILSRFTCISNS